MSAQELLWKYAEGHCDLAEQEKVEGLLTQDPGLKEELAQIVVLHSLLQSTELEKPSLRFTQNVIDVLPQLYPVESYEPLLGSFWKKLGIGVLSFTVVSIFISKSASPASLPGQIFDFSFLKDGFAKIMELIPASFIPYFLMLITAAGLLALADKMISRFQERHSWVEY